MSDKGCDNLSIEEGSYRGLDDKRNELVGQVTCFDKQNKLHDDDAVFKQSKLSSSESDIRGSDIEIECSIDDTSDHTSCGNGDSLGSDVHSLKSFVANSNSKPYNSDIYDAKVHINENSVITLDGTSINSVYHSSKDKQHCRNPLNFEVEDTCKQGLFPKEGQTKGKIDISPKLPYTVDSSENQEDHGNLLNDKNLLEAEDDADFADRVALPCHTDTSNSTSCIENESIEELKIPVRDDPQGCREWEEQASQVTTALTSGDVWKLRQLSASPMGLIKDTLRAQAWPILVGSDPVYLEPGPSRKEVEDHKEHKQVVMDVERTLRRFPPDMSASQRRILQDKLTYLTVRVFIKNPHLHYYQGFHDIGLTLLLVMNEEAAYNVLMNIVHSHLRDFLDENMNRTSALLELIYPIIESASPKLSRFLQRAELGTIFCLPWMITWFSHVLESVDPLLRLFDLFLATHPLMPLYLSAAVVLSEESALMSLPCEMPPLHAHLSRVSLHERLEQHVTSGLELFFRSPPCVLVADNQNLFKTSSILSTHSEFESSVIARSLFEPKLRGQRHRRVSRGLGRHSSAPPCSTGTSRRRDSWGISSRLVLAAAVALAGAVIVPVIKQSLYQ